MSCVSGERIERLLTAEGPSEELAAVREHARDCDPCRAAVSDAAERLLVRRLALDGGHLDSEMLSHFVDDGEGGPIQVLVETHLDACGYCRGRAEAMYEGRFRAASVTRAVSYEPVVTRPAPRLVSPRLIWTIAGAAALGAAIVTLLPGLRTRATPGLPTSGNPLAASRSEGKIVLRDGPFELVAEAGGPTEWRGGDPDARAELEAFLPRGILRDLRSSAPDLVRGLADPGSADRDDGIRPRPDAILTGAQVSFEWTGTRGVRYLLEVSRPERKLEPVLRREVREPRASVSLPPLPPGQVYTWTVVRLPERGFVVMERPFRIADPAEARRRIADWESRQLRSRLLRAALYERYGAFREALSEMRALAQEDGGDQAARLYADRRRELGTADE